MVAELRVKVRELSIIGHGYSLGDGSLPGGVYGATGDLFLACTGCYSRHQCRPRSQYRVRHFFRHAASVRGGRFGGRLPGVVTRSRVACLMPKALILRLEGS